MAFTNYIQQITDTGGTTHDLLDSSASHFIKGTQTASTNVWTGPLPDGVTAYYDGLMIDYWLPFAGTSTAATLNLGGLGAKPVYRGNAATSGVTTHIAAKTVAHLTYVVDSGINSGNGAWIMSSYYDSDSNTVDRLRDSYFRPYAGEAVYRYKFVMQGADNRMYPITVTNQTSGTQVAKVPTQVGLRPGRIWYYNTTATVAADGLFAANTLDEAFQTTAGVYNFNTDAPTYRMIYLKGTYDKATDLFTLYKDTSSPCTSYYTYVPTNTANITLSSYFTSGYYYILLGGTYSTANYISLFPYNPLYYFDGTNLIPASTKISGDTVTSVGVSNAVNGGLVISDSPVTSSGSITIGHSNVLANAQTTQAIYPIKIDKNGHISAYGTAVTPLTASSTLDATKLSGTIPASCYTNTWIAMVGATSSANGTGGYIGVNPPKDGYNTKYWCADGTWAVPPGTYSLPKAASSTLGGIKTGATTAGNVRKVEVDADGNAYVIQKDDDTTYAPGTGLSLDSTDNTFSVKLDYTTSGNNRKVQADTNGNLYVVQKDDDTKVSTAAVTSGTLYYPVVGADTTSAATKFYDKTGITYKGTNGTTSAVGGAELTLGNSTASGTANNKQGKLIIYGSTAYAHTIQGAPTAARTLTLPNASGMLALTDDIPTLQKVFGKIKVGSTTIEADTTQATLELVAGSNITLTPDATNDKITIAATGGGGGGGTDEKVATAAVSDDVDYFPVVGTDTTSAETKFYDKTGLGYFVETGTASAIGFAELTLGNNKSSTTIGNKQGLLKLYGSTAYAHTIQGAPTANRTLTLPDAGGTIALDTLASTSANGLMSSDDKTKLDSVGTFYSATWTATSSSALNTNLTTSFTINPGVYVVVVITPTASANFGMSVDSTPVFCLANGDSKAFIRSFDSGTKTIQAKSAQSGSVTFSNINRGAIWAVKIK